MWANIVNFMNHIKSSKENIPQDSLLILGAGGLGQAVAEIAKISGNFARYAFLDDRLSSDVTLDALDHLSQHTADFTHCIAAFGNNSLRAFYTAKIKELGFQLPVIVHPSAVISYMAHVAPGTIVRENVVISHEVIVEEGCLLNIGCLIDHNCHIGAFSHIPMGAVVRNAAQIPPQSDFKPQEVIEQ